jgi:3-oxoacyl-[acyl-carrier-protein] synthase-3
MAFLEIKNVRIAGVASGVPATIVKNSDDTVHSENYDAASFVESTGVEERRFSPELTTSDLGYMAAEQLISDLNWNKTEIDGLIFVSQGHDYIEPAT